MSSRHNSKRITKITLSATTITMAVLAFTACVGGPGSMRSPARGDGGSVVASIGGISDADLSNKDVGFWLVCSNGKNAKGEAKKQGDREYVSFPGKDIADKSQCAMEIRNDKLVNDASYKWFGMENGKPVPGLMYGSDLQTVLNRTLNLTLYKLYTKKEGETFKASLAVRLEIDDAKDMPADEKTAANLVCGDSERFPGTYKKTASNKDATLLFSDLGVKSMKDKACSKVVLLVDNKEAFAGAIDVKFASPEKDKTLSFPADLTKPYVLTRSGDLEISAEDGGRCLTHYDAVTKTCDDKRVVELKSDRSILLAEVHGKTANGDGDTVVYYVAARTGDTDDLGIFAGRQLTTKALNESLRAKADEPAAKAFNWYHESVATDLMKVDGDHKLMMGESLSSDAVARTELAPIRFLHIAKVYVHAFHEISAMELDKKSSAIWLGKLKLTKDGKPSVEIVVTGNDDYFHSPSVPAAVNGMPTYFDFKTFADELSSAAGSNKWRVYTVKNGPMALPDCQLESSFYLADLSLRDMHEMQPDLADRAIDACEVTSAEWNDDLATYKPETTLYLWHWLDILK